MIHLDLLLINNFSVAFIFLAGLSGIATAGDLKPFKSDGCSASPDGTIEQNTQWLNCCIKHDKAYWAGGTYEDRKKSDKLLNHCVDDVGEPEVAQLMFARVRVSGSPYLPTTFRWAYGWPYIRGYKALTDSEKKGN